MMFSLTITFMLSCLYGRSTTVVTQGAQSTFYREQAQDCDRPTQRRYCAHTAGSFFRPADAQSINTQIGAQVWNPSAILHLGKCQCSIYPPNAKAPFIKNTRKSAIAVRRRYCAQLTKLGLARSFVSFVHMPKI